MPSTPNASSYNPGSAFTPSSGYGNRTNPITGGNEFHSGQDYSAAAGTAIPAASDGVVVYSGMNSTYGNTVVIRSTGADGTSYYTLYAHQNGVDMPAINSTVTEGQTIGEVGDTGSSTGNHLHFEVLDGDANINNTAGGPLGTASSDQTVHEDPNGFNNWAGGAPYKSSALTAPEEGAHGGPEDTADPAGGTDGNVLAQKETITSGNDVVATIEDNGTIQYVISGSDAYSLTKSNTTLGLLNSSSLDLTGSNDKAYLLNNDTLESLSASTDSVFLKAGNSDTFVSDPTTGGSSFTVNDNGGNDSLVLAGTNPTLTLSDTSAFNGNSVTAAFVAGNIQITSNWTNISTPSNTELTVTGAFNDTTLSTGVTFSDNGLGSTINAGANDQVFVTGTGTYADTIDASGLISSDHTNLG